MLVKNNGSSQLSFILPLAPNSYISQVFQIVCNADVSGSLNAKFINLPEVYPGVGAYLWFNVASAGYNPGPFGQMTAVEVSFAENATASTIASDIASAINSNLSGRFSAVASSTHVTITAVVGGVISGAFNDYGQTGFAFSIVTAGAANYQYSLAPGQVLQLNDSLAQYIQNACLANPGLEIILGGVAYNCSFIIDHANGNGLGIRTLKGPSQISQVYGYSSVPIAGNNVPSGFVQVFFDQSFSQYFGGFAGMVSPLSGSNVDAGSFVAGTVYVITVVGNTNWQAIGLPSSVVAAPGVAFIATGVGSGTGVVQAPGVSGIESIEIVGNPNLTLNASGGGYILMQYLLDAVVTQPNDNSVVGATFYLG